jgi:hypothetical protein
VWTKHLQRSCQVRNQVDFGSKTHQNRYGLRAGIYAERILHLRQIKNFKNLLLRIFYLLIW